MDKSKIYFLSAAWATSCSVHVYYLNTRSEKFLCDGNSIRIIDEGVYIGKLIISKHKYNNAGAYDHFFIVDENGNEIKDLGENPVE